MEGTSLIAAPGSRSPGSDVEPGVLIGADADLGSLQAILSPPGGQLAHGTPLRVYYLAPS